MLWSLARSRLARWLALLPLLLAVVWLLHLASHLQGEEAGPAAESCLVCLHLAGDQTPLPSVPGTLPTTVGSYAPAFFVASPVYFSPALQPRQGAPPLA